MKLLQRYVVTSFVTAFLLGILVLTFVLSIGLLVKAMELVVRGLAASLVLDFLFVSVPQSFTFTVPLASLASALLVFGRLSSDSEISAMKACGVNVGSVMWPLALLGALMCALSIHINQQISPRSHFARHTMSAMAKSGAVMDLLQPGHFIQDVPGISFWFASREGNELSQLLIFDRTRGSHKREIRAERAIMEVDGSDLRLDMYNVRIEPFSDTKPGAATADRLIQVIEGAMKPRKYNPKVASLQYGDLLASMDELRAKERELLLEGEALADGGAPVPQGRENGVDDDSGAMDREELELALKDVRRRLSMARTENHRRFSLGVAPIVFILLGMPLGIRSHRRESNIGVIVSLLMMVLYYSLLIASKTLAAKPELYPHLLVWAPTAICVVVGVVLIRRNL